LAAHSQEVVMKAAVAVEKISFTHSESTWGLWKSLEALKNDAVPDTAEKRNLLLNQLKGMLVLPADSQKAEDVADEIIAAEGKVTLTDTFAVICAKCDESAVLSLKVKKVVSFEYLLEIAKTVKHLRELKAAIPTEVLYESDSSASQTRRQGKSKTAGLTG
jgi:hypothetical protein